MPCTPPRSNIRARRGAKVAIRAPLLRDAATPAADVERGIEMDAMAFGMGCCCLQVTFQARDIDESRHLYDHLAVLSPIMLALTAATPVLGGRLADSDVRWSTVAASVDDRTPQERGEADSVSSPWSAEQLRQFAGGGVRPLAKSRYDSISYAAAALSHVSPVQRHGRQRDAELTPAAFAVAPGSYYIANCSGCQDRFNDLEGAPVDEEALQMLLDVRAPACVGPSSLAAADLCALRLAEQAC